MQRQQNFWSIVTLALLMSLILAACGGQATPEPAAPAQEAAPAEEEAMEEVAAEEPAEEEVMEAEAAPAGEATTLSMWYHGAGNDVERDLIWPSGVDIL